MNKKEMNEKAIKRLKAYQEKMEKLKKSKGEGK